MLKKIAVASLIAAFLIGGSFHYAQAQNVSLSQFIEILISIGVIPQEKIAAARALVASSAGNTTTSTGQTTTAANSSNGSLVISPASMTITRSQTAAANGRSTTTVDAKFNITLQAVGSDVYFGTQPSANTFAFGIYKDGVRIGLSTANAIAWSVPAYGVVTNGLPTGTAFKLPQNNSVTIPVDFVFEGRDSYGNSLPTGNYSVGLEAVRYGMAAGNFTTTNTSMSGNAAWRTASVALTSDGGNTSYTTCMTGFIMDASGACNPSSPNLVMKMLSPNGGETLTAGQTYRIKWYGGNTKVDVELLDDPTRLGKKIFAGIPNNGYVDWTVAPLTASDLYDFKTGTYKSLSGKYVMYVTCSDSNCIVDDSDSPFAITSTANTPAPISFTAPTSGQTFTAGSLIPVSFLNPVVGTSYVIQLRGKAYSYNLGTVSVSSATDQSKNSFYLPSSVPSDAAPLSLVLMVNGADVASLQGINIISSVYPTTQACAGSQPSGAGVVTGNTYYTTGYGTNQWTFVTGTPNACQWSCASGYGLSGNGCALLGTAAPTYPVTQSCGGVQPTSNGYTQVGGGYYTTGYGTTQWTFVTGTPYACQYTCMNGGVYTGNGCAAPAPAPAPTPAPAPSAPAPISAPSLSTSSWYADDPSTWPTVSTLSALNGNQAMRVKGFDGSQYYDKTFGVNSAKITASPAAGTSQLILYVYDYGTGNYATDQKTVNVSITNKPAAQTSAVTGSISVTPSTGTTNSNGFVTLNLTVPSNALAEKLNVSCPAGVSVFALLPSYPAPQNICNAWQTLASGATSISLQFVNGTGQVQTVSPNFGVTTVDNPNFTNSVSTSIIVNPGATSMNTGSSNAAAASISLEEALRAIWALSR